MIKLWIPTSGLKGSLSSSLGSLDQLIELNFSYNDLDGVVSNDLFSLQNLQVLDMSFNNLYAPITHSERTSFTPIHQCFKKLLFREKEVPKIEKEVEVAEEGSEGWVYVGTNSQENKKACRL